MGILSLMYHRFDEEKYPSTNIKMNIFKDYGNRKNKNNNSRVNNRVIFSGKKSITLPISKMLQKFGAKANRDNILAKKRSELNVLRGGGRMNTTTYNKLGDK